MWLEEVAAQRHLGEVLKHTALGLRIGDHPHYVASTTPLPRPEVINLVTDPRTVLTRGRTRDAHRLDPVVRAVYEEKWGGTTAGRTELDGELLRSVPGALWVPERMPGEEAPADDERPAIVRVPAGAVGYTSHNTDDPGPTAPILVHRTVVSVDPNAGGDDEAGIHVIGAIDRTAYVLADLSGNMTSDRWARTAVQAYYDYGAEGIALEKSGGDAPSTIIRSITLDDGRTGAGVPIFLMPTKVGKRLRAEPVQAVSQQGRLIMVGSFPKTESQMTTWVPDVDPDSPDRVDSLVHGVTYLIIRNAPATTANPAHATRRINRRR